MTNAVRHYHFADETYAELMDEDYRDDPVGHETKHGEGWTRCDFETMFLDSGNEADSMTGLVA